MSLFTHRNVAYHNHRCDGSRRRLLELDKFTIDHMSSAGTSLHLFSQGIFLTSKRYSKFRPNVSSVKPEDSCHMFVIDVDFIH